MRWTPRWAIFVAFLAVSVVLTVLLWPNGAFLFLFFPFMVPWRSRRTVTRRACPTCGWSSVSGEDRFCPRDGSALSA